MAREPVSVTVETITPAKAERWLGHNTHNRHIRPKRVERFAAAMRRGEWTLSGATISFDRQGVLLDGQHRLLAVIESGVSIKSLVVHNLEPEAQDVIDDVTPRSLADKLKLIGVANASEIAAVLRFLYRQEQGSMRDLSVKPTIPEGMAILAAHPNVSLSLLPAKRVAERLGGPRSLYAYLHYTFASIDSEDADYFFEHLASGEGLDTGSPIFALRRFLERERMQKQHRVTPLHVRMAVFIKAWNHFRAGESVSVVVWRAGGANPEKWPVAK